MKLTVVTLQSGAKALKVKMEYLLPANEIACRIYHQMEVFCVRLPVTRKEALDLAIKDVQQGYNDGMDDEDIDERVIVRVAHLFPEL